MGRSPCCAKEGLNRGAWTAIEDQILTAHIKAHGEGKWRSLPKRAGLKRCGKSCRLRWLNYLKPGIKRGNITPDEEELIIKLHNLLGNRWSLIAGRLPGRTDNEIKNYWNTSLSKRTGAHSSLEASKRSQVNKSKAKISRAKTNAAPAAAVTTTSEPTSSPAAAAVRTKVHRFTKRLVLDVNYKMLPTPSCNSDIKSASQATQPDGGTYCDDQVQGLDVVHYDHDDLNSLKFTAYDFQAISTDDHAANDDCTFAEDSRKLDWMVDELFEDNSTVDLGSLASWLEQEDWPFEENHSSKV